MSDVYLLDMLFTKFSWPRCGDIDGKHVIYFSHKISLENMTNHPEIKTILS